jgi:hypothetical protein
MNLNETTTTLTTAQIEDLQLSFAMMNPIEFARHLQTLDIPDRVKAECLAAKVNQKPTEREDAMQNAISRAMTAFWNRLSESANAS